MRNVTVIVPSWKYWADPIKLQPLWELYYATVIADRVADVVVDMIDLRSRDELDPLALIPESDVYFFWIMKSADAVEIEQLTDTLRHRNPSARFMAGGTHVDNHVERTAKVMDAVFVGSAEELIVHAFEDLATGRLMNVYRPLGKMPFTDYPHARRDFLPPERIVNYKHFQHHGSLVGTGAYFSRGCSFSCNFCTYNVPDVFEYRTGPQIRAEIGYLKSTLGVEAVNLRDEVCVPVNPKLASEYLGAIGEEGIKWRGQTVALGKEESVRLAADSGCLELALGIESAAGDHVLELINKPVKKLDTAKRYIEYCKKYGIKVKLCLIIGLPGEGADVAEKTIRFLDEVQPDYLAVSGFDPLPGSIFFRDRQKYGIKHIDDDLTKHSHLVFRYGDDEEVGLPFEYEEDAPWGKGLTRQQIIENLKIVQQYAREKQLNY